MTTAEITTPPTPSRRRLWLFRLAALTLVPAAVWLAAETALRLAGAGEPTSFLVPAADEGFVTPNQKYGWRFFPRTLARAPVPFLLPEDKGDAYRIFVIGGSAARGTPDSAYSFGRVLEVVLEARYPGTRFEVLNAAMTAINSHVALDVVRTCAGHQPDLFIVYLGNNEVVGPYGAGTIFGSFSPSLTMIRASIGLRATRLGQLAAAALGAGGDSPPEWRGMEMFLEQRVAADDPRLEKVYRHFERNLEDMVAAAERADAKILLSTVATNLRDQPPFASLHRAGLSSEEEERWRTLVEAGVRAADAGDAAAALVSWRDAAAIDDRYAEPHYRVGRLLLALGRTDEARDHLTRARDLDALRFRADSEVNRTIRRVAETGADRGTVLLDAARRFADGGDGIPPLPGRRLFWEHVHLSFEGNHALAAAVAERLDDVLPARVVERVAGAPATPSLAEVAERLALTHFDRLSLERDILDIVSRPPFVGQLDHAADLEQRRLSLGQRKRKLDPAAWRNAETVYRQALARDAEDLEIRRRFATLLQARGRHRDAVEHWRFLLERQPAIDGWRSSLATALAAVGDGEAALAELEEVRRRSGDSADLRVNRGALLERLGRQAQADEEYTEALRLAPGHKLASFNLATSALKRGQVDRAAELFRELLERHDFAPAHHNLGRCLEQQERLDDAVAAYRHATATDPGLSAARNSLALALERRGETGGAIAEYRLLLAYEPDYALAHFNLADLLLSLGRAAEAASHYRRGLELTPGNAQGRANLELALRLLATRD